MIFGIGTDIIEIARVESAIAKEAFKQKYFLSEKSPTATQQKKQKAMLPDSQPKKHFSKHWAQVGETA
jgi:phosphopantetheinyl transferase (holo-ACP synthase)